MLFLACNTIFNTALWHTEIASSSCLLLLMACRPAKKPSAHRAASQRAFSGTEFLWSPSLRAITGTELLGNSSLWLDSQCPPQWASKRLLLAGFLIPTQHIKMLIECFQSIRNVWIFAKYLQLHYSWVNFWNQTILKLLLVLDWVFFCLVYYYYYH